MPTNSRRLCTKSGTHLVRSQPFAVPNRLVIVAFFAVIGWATTGCNHEAAPETLGHAEVLLDPSHPSVGDCNLTVKLFGPTGRPLEDAELTVEGNMNHAGMKPSFAEISESDEPGVYLGTIDFTMGGDWFLLVSAIGPDGVSVESKVDVPGVQTK